MPSIRTSWFRIVGFVTVVVLLLAVGGYVAYLHLRPRLLGTGCEARGADSSVRLDPEQAANAATITGVGLRKRLPERAVVIALATALQESHLYNLPYGDRDSVGLFQQRPSQGWGTVRELMDPVYAASRFYDSLVKVPGYRHLPIYEAAQDVQRSADGMAYAQHEPDATVLAEAFTGRIPHGVRCWWPPDQRTPRVSTADALTRTFGPLHIAGPSVSVPSARYGWALAAWAVAHAKEFGLRSVSYAGYTWTARDGYDGWQPDKHATASAVEIR